PCTWCHGSCVDVSANREHCGGCDNSCNVGEECVSGGCASCVECVSGNARCVTQSSYQDCLGPDANGCFLWSEETACVDAMSCDGDGECVEECATECDQEDERICDASGTAYRTCGQYDTDACLDLSSPVPCGQGSVCVDGECRRLNVLFIAIDDLNDWVGVLSGHPQASTPHLDRLSSQGLLFTNAHTAAPACNPSRAALLTGIRPSSSGVYRNSQPWRPVMADAVTLPDHFRRNGYKTLGAGKIFHGQSPDPFLDPRAWDVYYPGKCRQRPSDPKPAGLPLNGIPDTGHFDWGPVDVSDEAMGDRKVADWVAQQLTETHDRPFFLACGFFRPHLPWYVPPAYFAQHPLDDIELPVVAADDLDDVPPAGQRMANPDKDHANVIAYDQWHAGVQGYLASLRFADAMLGMVLDALEASPHVDNTIVVLWTDHGWHLGEKEHWRKFTLWEESTRVPLIIVAPGVTTAGSRTDRPVSLMDLYPTLIDLAGLPPKPELQGRSLVSLLQDPEDSSSTWTEPVLTTYKYKNHALRDSRWRYIRYENGDEELYDHTVDPREWNNLIPNLPGDTDLQAIRDEMAGWLDAHVEDAPDVPTRDDYPPDELKCEEDE
ncbi:sulfatase-like hydrolase/transferase, partial [Myxococcota bacterium]